MSELSRYYDVKKMSYTEGTPKINDVNIEQVIIQIINKRKDKVPTSEGIKRMLDNLSEELLSFIKQKNDIYAKFSGQDTSESDLSSNERREILGRISDITDEEVRNIIRKIEAAQKVNDDLLKRINKDNICIAIAGGARNGKSTLIQTITGLDEATVPTSEEGFCTGARSTIENCGEFRVEVEFYTTEELIREVISQYTTYFKDYGADSIKITSLADISKLYDYLRKQDLPRGSEYLKRLNEYAEKKDIYSEYLGSEVKTYYEKDKDKIRKFVSQISEDGNTKYYEFLAVKRARIYCPFAVTSVKKIVLVDTVGLGEASLGVETDMLETASKEADFIINLKQMSKLPTAIMMEPDWDHYNKIVQANGKVPPEKWCYWVFNRRQDQYKDGLFQGRYFNEVIKFLKNKNNPSYPAGILNVDCSNRQEVMEQLINPMLAHIVNNLEDIDKYHFLKVSDSIKEVEILYTKLMAKVKMVSVSETQEAEFFSFKFEESYKKLVSDLHDFSSKYKEEFKRSVPALEMLKITNDMVKCVPKANEIKEKWNTVSKQSYLLTMNWAFDETVKRLEVMLEDRTKNYEKEIAAFKKKVAQKILEASGLEKCIVIDLNDDLLVNRMSKELFGSLERCKNLRLSFDSMQSFDIKDQLDMQKKLNNATQHYLNVNYNPKDSGLFPLSWTRETGVVELERVLFNHIAKIQASFMLDAEMLRLLPVHEMEHKLDAFINDLTNDENKEGWRMVYEANKEILWKDELESIKADMKQINEWAKLLDKMQATGSKLTNILSDIIK